ncbi:MAG: ABC transporter, substrate-binding protein (cluster 3, basic aa/glutamine/opines) [uncultured Paraburkholderia sp.]|nr:MAG: ABC transporter, substrate-binding protein (cluster 3, basic aa/glutamine/opines) [uncultured Paraburkholderia sp.]CAH2913893.1 MAG: ABC transporter, substrate-binding protein (cluster 3, basic aa/glutamine/opines) [uncultured Paraburkholderia sp.]
MVGDRVRIDQVILLNLLDDTMTYAVVGRPHTSSMFHTGRCSIASAIEHARQRLHLLEQSERERTEEASEATAVLALRDFAEDMKASGFVADALARCGIAGASVALACGSGTSSFDTIGKRKCPLCAVGLTSARHSNESMRLNARPFTQGRHSAKTCLLSHDTFAASRPATALNTSRAILFFSLYSATYVRVGNSAGPRWHTLCKYPCERDK